MATIGVGAGSYMRPRYAKCRTRTMRVDASQTVLVGSLMVLSADSDEGNRVKVAGADPTTDGGSPTASETVVIWLAEQGTEFIAHVQASETLDNDDIGVEFGLVIDATNGIMRVDTSETTAKLVRVLELLDAHGDTEGRVSVAFIAPERLYGD